jgi:hypothetical protein
VFLDRRLDALFKLLCLAADKYSYISYTYSSLLLAFVRYAEPPVAVHTAGSS